MSAWKLEHMLLIAWNSLSNLIIMCLWHFFFRRKERLFQMTSLIDIISNRIYNVYVHKDISMFFVKQIFGRFLRFKLSLPNNTSWSNLPCDVCVCVCVINSLSKIGFMWWKETRKKTCVNCYLNGDDGNMCDFISQFSNPKRIWMCFTVWQFLFHFMILLKQSRLNTHVFATKFFPILNETPFFLLLFVSANINVIKWLNLKKFIKQCVKYWAKLVSHV